MMMAIWPAMLLAPLLVLGAQTLAFALAPVLCASQDGAWLHIVAALSTLACAALAIIAARQIVRAPENRRFFAQVATGVATLSALTLLALWVPVWTLEPCIG
jgi:hypothetical protein